MTPRLPPPLRPARAHPASKAAAFAILLTGVLLIWLPRPLSPDVAGQLWMADRLRHGARLYGDIAEINPPLWFWLAAPVDALADLLRVSGASVLIAAIGGAALGSLLATERLLRPVPPARRTALLLYAALILLVMPLRDTGQREQIALIGALPYAALIAARREERPVAVGLALAVGLGAAVAFALKHYFAGVPLLLELWLAVSLRRGWRPLRPETLALLTAAILYGAAIVALTPDYLRVTVPELRLAYGAFGAPAWRYMIRPAQPVWLLIAGGLLMAARAARPLPALTAALLLAALGFGAAWLIQHKGWPYQSIPTTGVLALALASAIAGRGRPRPIALAALIAPVLLCLPPTQWVPTRASDIAPALADLRPGDTVAIVSREGWTAWPAAVDRGLRFVGRRTSWWLLDAVDANARGPRDPRVAALGRAAVRQAVSEYRCQPPKRLIFAPGWRVEVTTAGNNPLGYFLREPAFVRLLGRYHRLPSRADYVAFSLVGRLPPADRASCPNSG